jgi:N-acetyltransferase
MSISLNIRKRIEPNCSEVNENEPKKPKLIFSDVQSHKKQLCLDLGQKKFGHVRCKVCGMIYTFGLYEDQLEHYRYHRRQANVMSFQGWKKERVVATFNKNDRIIKVLPTDSKKHLNKLSEIFDVMNTELGFKCNFSLTDKRLQTFLYISDKKVIGCVLVESITQAYRLLPSVENRDDTYSLLCSEFPEAAVMGVLRLWVTSSHRLKGIATCLLETARTHFVFGFVVPKSSIAFSDPTSDGRKFATKFCQTSEFLIHTFSR